MKKKYIYNPNTTSSQQNDWEKELNFYCVELSSPSTVFVLKRIKKNQSNKKYFFYVFYVYDSAVSVIYIDWLAICQYQLCTYLI